RAPATSSASPHTSRSGSVASSAARPSRTTGWSSTISTRAGPFATLSSLLVTAIAPPHRTGDHGAPTFRRADLQHSADDAGPVTHGLDAHTLLLGGRRRHADAIVLDRQAQACRSAAEGEADVLRPAVPQGIAHGLLGDTVQVPGHERVSHRHRFGTVEVA